MFMRLSTLGATVALGVVVTATAAAIVGSREVVAARLQFQQRTTNLSTVLQRNLSRHVDVLQAIGDYYQAMDLTVDPAQFRRFVERSLNENSGIQALEWAPYVLAGQRQRFEATMQAQGFSAFQITERDGANQLRSARLRRTYVPVAYVEPLVGNEVAVGFDLASNPVRRQALEQARIHNQIIASGRITLVQETADQYGFLVFLPVYSATRFEGYILGVFRVADVVAEAIATLQTDLSFHLYDDSAPSGENYLGTYADGNVTVTQTAAASNPDAFLNLPRAWNALYLCNSGCEQPFDFAGRQWRLYFLPPSYPVLPTATIAIVIVGSLITALIAIIQQRSQATLAQAQELSALKQQLFGMASHELRTPLSTILLSAQSLEAAPDLPPEKARRIYQRIRFAAKQMTQLLNDLLILNRAEAGKLDYTPEAVRLRDLCHTCIALVQMDVAPRITLHDHSQPEPVWLDPKLVQAILTNLLTNALKYSESTVALELTCQPHHVTLVVRDQGLGIPAADQPHLFETFYRGRNVEGIAGTGLGLAIVHSCTRLHQGTIDFCSSEHQGTVFTVQLPTRPPVDSPHRTQSR